MLKVKTFVFNSFQVNTYVLYDETLDCVIVDCGCTSKNEENQLEQFLSNENLKPVRHLITHPHIDHILGADFIFRKYALLPEFHEKGMLFYETAPDYAMTFGLASVKVPKYGTFLTEGNDISFGNSKLKVLYTPGHADGSVCFLESSGKFLISGDVLFNDSIGRTDLPTGNFDLLMKSIKDKLFSLDDSTIVFPGHGPSTSIGNEKANNPFIS
jgi:hydroxyacylglutathione hydrolase